MPDAHDELTAALAAQAQAERRVHRAVHRVREDGWTWSQIADVLGVTRQAAHRRFASAPAAVEHGDARQCGGAWWLDARRAAEDVAHAWFRGDLGAVHAGMTSTARAALPQSALRRVMLEVEELAGRCPAPDVTGVHEIDGEPLRESPGAGGPGRRRAVVIRLVATGEHAEPVVHALVGPGGRVSGLSVRLSDTLEEWPL